MADRRQKILRAALECFVAKGFHGTSTREICRHAGISSGLIFHYFPTKEAVYEELVRHALTSVAPDPAATHAEPLTHLRDLATWLLETLRQHPEAALLFRLASQAQYQRGISPVVDDLFDSADLIEAHLPIIAEGQASGVLRPGDPRALATAFFTALQGLAEEVSVHPDHPLPEVEWYLDLIRTPRS